MVRDLKHEEISLELGGKPVDIGYLGFRDVDTAFVVLLENSPRTAPHGVSVPQWGQINQIDRVRYHLAYDFFPMLTEVGVVLLGEFFEELEVLQSFTAHPESLIASVHEIKPRFTGILIDQIEVGRMIGRAVDMLAGRREKRKVVVLFTTTVDRTSYENLDEYQGMLRESDVDLYIVSFAARNYSGSSATFHQRMNSFYFKRLVAETGGMVYITGEYAYLDDLFTDLKARLTNSYTIGFYVDSQGAPEEREVTIDVTREKCRVTHRKFMVY
jgi:hypothetical protein